MLTEFVQTCEVLPLLSAGEVEQSWLVLLTVGSVGLVFMLFVLLGVHFDGLEEKREKSTKIAESSELPFHHHQKRM